MNYTQSKGNLVELQCISKFIELGYECSVPYGNGAKYDFIADLGDKLIRVQCKASSQVKKKNGELDDAFSFSTISQTTNTQKTTRHKYTKEQIDYFATVYDNKVYLVPVEECSNSKTLRFSAPQNNNKYNKAEDYEIEKIFSYSEELISSKEELINRTSKSYSEKPIIKCINCGKELLTKNLTNLCKDCYDKEQRTCERPNREELKDMIRNIPFTKIAEKYNVSDKAITKWCLYENLPSKKKDIKSYSDEEWRSI